MKKKLLLLWILILCLTVTTVSAVTLNNAEAYYSFDNTTISGTNVTDLSGNGHWATNTGTIWSAGKLNESRNYNGLNQYIDTHNDWWAGAGAFSLNFWINYTAGGTRVLVDKASGLANNRFAIVLNVDENNNADNGNVVLLTRDTLIDRLAPTVNPNLDDGTWHMVTAIYNGASSAFYIDGSSVAVSGGVRPGNVVENGKKHRFGSSYQGNFDYTGKLDEFAIYLRALNSTEIQALWNGGSGYNPYAPGPTGDLVLTEITPYPKAQYNTNPATVWTLANTTYNNWNCTLYINGTINQTQTLINGTNINCSFNINLTNGIWIAKIRGQTATTDVNTSNTTLYFDNTAPVIASTNFVNNTLFYVGDGNITGQWNITDNFFLYRVTSTFNGTVIDNITEINLTAYSYNMSFDISAYPPGTYPLIITVSDGHTDSRIIGDSYDWYNGLFNDYLEFEFRSPYKETGILLENKDGGIWDSWKAVEKIDRYSFSFEPGTITDKYTIDITSESPIHILTKENFSWLVFDNHWIDFAPYEASFERISQYQIRATILNPNLDEKLIFESIGDLNIINVTYNVIITNMTVIYSNPVVEGSNQTFILRIYTPGGITGTNASLVWNGTTETVTKTSLANYDRYTSSFLMPALAAQATVNFSWYYNITSPANNLTGNITNNQTIYSIGLDDCSVYTTRAINFSLMNEENLSLIGGTGTIDTTITAYPIYSNKAVSETVYLSYTGNNTYGLCIYPAWSTYTIDFNFMEYAAPGFGTREYKDTGLVINNVTQQIPLYLLSNTTVSDVIITVRDQDDNTLEGYFIEIQRYYPGTGQTITTQTIKTDYKGQAMAQLLLNSAEYSFIIKNTKGIIVKTISAAKIYTTSLVFIVDLTAFTPSFQDKVWYQTTPDSPVNPAVITFSLITDSPGNYIQWYRIHSLFNGTNYQQNKTGAGGGTASISINLSAHAGSWINIDYEIQAQNESLYTFTRGYYISDVTPTTFSIESQATNWETLADELWRVIIAVFISICAILLFVTYTGPEAAGIIGLLVQMGFVYLDWIPIWMIIIEVILVIGGYLILSRGEI